jgi:hypothetical protein
MVMADSIEKQAKSVEHTLETKGSTEAMKELQNDTATMSDQEKRVFLDTLQQANDNSPYGTARMTQKDAGNGDVDVNFKNENGSAAVAALPKVVKWLFTNAENGATEANKAVGAEQQDKSSGNDNTTK